MKIKLQKERKKAQKKKVITRRVVKRHAPKKKVVKSVINETLATRIHEPHRKWRKPVSYFVIRLFNLDPERDFGILDELLGAFFILLLGLTTITIIFGKEATKTWTDTTDTDWAKSGAVKNNVETIRTGADASIALKKEGGGWTKPEKPMNKNIMSVAMFSSSSGFAVGEDGMILRTDDGGRSWTSVTSSTNKGLWSVTLASATNGAAVGNDGMILEWNGSSWQVADSPTVATLLGVSLAGSKGFVVGESGKIVALSGGAWTELAESPTTKTLFGVAMLHDLAFAVGEDGEIIQWNGSTWSVIDSPSDRTLVAVKLFSSSSGIAVGEGGTIIRWNGTKWTKQTSGTTKDLNAISIAGTKAVVGGGDGAVMRWNGSSWALEAVGSSESIFGLALQTSGETIAVGSSGLIATYTGATYASEGTYTSATKDAEKPVTWDLVQRKTTPDNATIRLQVAANDDNATWTYMDLEGGKVPAGIGKKRYLRYQATLATEDTSKSPSLDSITIISKEEIVEEPKKEEEKKVEEKKEPEEEVPPTPKIPEETPPVIPSPPPPSPLPTASTGSQSGSGTAKQLITPQLVSPTNNALLQVDTIEFQWQTIAGTPSYRIEVDRENTFVNPIIRATASGSSYTAPPLSVGSYFWRVLPEIPATVERRGEWSGTFTFTLTEKPPLPKVASPTLIRPIGVDSSTITLDGIAFPYATVRIIITSNIVEKTVVADTNGAWRIEVARSLFASGQHIAQAQIFTAEGQVTPAITIGEFFIPFPPPPTKNAAVATARAIGSAATQVSDATKKAAKKTVEETVVVAEKAEKIIQENETGAKVALGATVPVVTVANPTMLPALSNLHLLIYHFFSGLLSLFGIKKKRRPWGIVYDAITKEPIGLAIIRLFDEHKKLLETQVTDNEGRFGFLVQPSSYTLEVVKQDFAYPSKLVTGKTDGDFEDCYHGETLATKEGTINVSVPLDPLNKKEARKKQPLLLTVKNVMHVLALPLLIVGWAGSWFVVLFAFSTTNLAMTFIYLFFAVIHVVLLPKKFRPWGTVFSANSLEPVPLAVISIIDTKFNRVLKSRLTDYSGRFNFLPPAGEYKLTVKKEGFSFPVKDAPQTKKFKNLYVGQDIIVKKEKAIVSTDVPVRKQ